MPLNHSGNPGANDESYRGANGKRFGQEKDLSDRYSSAREMETALVLRTSLPADWSAMDPGTPYMKFALSREDEPQLWERTR